MRKLESWSLLGKLTLKVPWCRLSTNDWCLCEPKQPKYWFIYDHDHDRISCWTRQGRFRIFCCEFWWILVIFSSKHQGQKPRWTTQPQSSQSRQQSPRRWSNRPEELPFGTNYSGSGQTSPLALRFICCQGWHKKHLAVLGILIGNKHSKHQYGVLIFVEISQSIHPSSLAEPDAEQIPLQRSNWISEVHPKKGSQARPGVGGSLERRFRGGCWFLFSPFHHCTPTNIVG